MTPFAEEMAEALRRARRNHESGLRLDGTTPTVAYGVAAARQRGYISEVFAVLRDAHHITQHEEQTFYDKSLSI